MPDVPEWRVCNEHALRLLYARLLFSVSEHRRRVTTSEWPRDHADSELWKILVEANFGETNDG